MHRPPKLRPPLQARQRPEPIVEAELVVEKRPSGLLLGVVAGGGVLFAIFLSIVVILLLVKTSRTDPRLVGQWIHVDAPPSRPAKALMSVGSKVISDRVYTFSSMGSVTQELYGRGVRGRENRTKGSWKIAPDQNGSDEELTILIQFPNRQPIRMHVRFVDRENAELRLHNSYPESYYKVK